MNSFLDDLTLEQLDGDSRELAEVIGMDAFKKLVEVYGGSGSLYIPSAGGSAGWINFLMNLQ